MLECFPKIVAIMSDNWITLIPEDPYFVPDKEKWVCARDRLAKFAPQAEQIETKVTDKVQFFDCGANFERICCPSCGSGITIDWWQDRMDEDFTDGFKLTDYLTPCCGVSQSLNELVYEWPQGFGRFALNALNPNIGLLEDEHKRDLEKDLGTKLRVIYQAR